MLNQKIESGYFNEEVSILEKVKPLPTEVPTSENEEPQTETKEQ